MSPGNLFILGSKGQGQNVFVGLQTERNIAAVVYVSHAGFFSAWTFALWALVGFF